MHTDSPFAIRATGLPDSPAELDIWYKPVPASSNRALAILEAAKLYIPPANGSDPRRRLFGSAAPRSLSSNDVALVETILTNNQSVFPLLHQCAELPESRYPINLSQGPSTRLPHLANVISLVELLLLDALFQSYQTNIANAVRSLNAAFAVADSLRNEPLLVSGDVRMQAVRQAVAVLSRLLSERQLTQDQLDSIGQSLAVAEETGKHELLRGLVGDRACDVTVFAMTFSEIEQIEPAGFLSSDGLLQPVAFQLYRASGIRQRDFSCYLQVMDEFIAAAKLDLPASLKEFERAETDLSDRLAQRLGRFAVLSRNLLIPLGKAGLKEANSTAILRSARVALAIEKFRLAHGSSLPSNLDDLAPRYIHKLPADPYDGTPLRFERTSDKGYKVFAAGAVAANRTYHSPNATNLSFVVHR